MQRGAVSPASDPVPPEPVSRFRAALERLNPGGGPIGLAVSGGPDSMAMLLLAHAAIPGRFAVATVDHGLRPEAKDECALVARVCAERGVECAVLAAEVGPGNVQAQAREARYREVSAWAEGRQLRNVATAHHVEDQAETLLMRLNRGSGISGLAAIRQTARIGTLSVIRPLLDWHRSELEGICGAAGIVPVRDPSNDNPEFDRVRIRQALASADWIDTRGLARSAALIEDARRYVQQCLSIAWINRVREVEGGFDYLPGFNEFENVEMALLVLQKMRATPSRSDVSRMVALLWEDSRASLGGVLASPVKLDGDLRNAPCRSWQFRPEPPRRTG